MTIQDVRRAAVTFTQSLSSFDDELSPRAREALRALVVIAVEEVGEGIVAPARMSAAASVLSALNPATSGWGEIGVLGEVERSRWMAYNFTPETAKNWVGVLPPEVAFEFRSISPSEALIAHEAGMRLSDAQSWIMEGFPMSEGVIFHAAHAKSDVARLWTRQTGWDTGDATAIAVLGTPAWSYINSRDPVREKFQSDWSFSSELMEALIFTSKGYTPRAARSFLAKGGTASGAPHLRGRQPVAGKAFLSLIKAASESPDYMDHWVVDPVDGIPALDDFAPTIQMKFAHPVGRTIRATFTKSGRFVSATDSWSLKLRGTGGGTLRTQTSTEFLRKVLRSPEYEELRW